ncbi:8946_t:CDS:2 [Funneliformis geosporum]|uniref:8946_t:CDS:1 n=1 Tax=Funneliformis geosporum TaxID=1117311 RepID=A0A9W4SP89_9GLOM|nr:8946_t:CDS:2 [Funneliformis geosporum]
MKTLLANTLSTSSRTEIQSTDILLLSSLHQPTQDEFEMIIIKQKNKIDEILSKFEEQKFNTEIGISKKEGKDKGKKNRIEFYQVNIYNKLKAHLKAKLDSDEYYTNQLQKLKDNNIKSLWSIFGFNRIKPYEDNWSKEQIKDGRQDDEDEQYEEKKEMQDSLQYSEHAFTDKELYNFYQSLDNDANFMKV